MCIIASYKVPCISLQWLKNANEHHHSVSKPLHIPSLSLKKYYVYSHRFLKKCHFCHYNVKTYQYVILKFACIWLQSLKKPCINHIYHHGVYKNIYISCLKKPHLYHYRVKKKSTVYQYSVLKILYISSQCLKNLVYIIPVY